MSPSGPMTAAPPLPPGITQQQQAPMSTFAGMAQAAPGSGIPDPLQVAQGKLAELESWAASTAPVLEQIDPGLAPLLVPIAQAGKALMMEISNMQQRAASVSPQVAGTNPPNLPGNMPGGRPAM